MGDEKSFSLGCDRLFLRCDRLFFQFRSGNFPLGRLRQRPNRSRCHPTAAFDGNAVGERLPNRRRLGSRKQPLSQFFGILGTYGSGSLLQQRTDGGKYLQSGHGEQRLEYRRCVAIERHRQSFSDRAQRPIVFGPNARLDIGGSFVASTAESIGFEDGSSFGVSGSEVAALLTISVPAGLQLGQNPGEIQVRGVGSDVSIADPIFLSVGRETSDTGLRVAPGRTLALVGGELNLAGAGLVAEGGRIELGAAGLGSHSLVADGFRLAFRLRERNRFSRHPSLSTVGCRCQRLWKRRHPTGRTPNYIRPKGRSCSPKTSGRPRQKPYKFELLNRWPFLVAVPFLAKRSASGGGSDIFVATEALTFQNTSLLAARTFGEGDGGDLEVRASNFIEIADVPPNLRSAISSETRGVGRGGDLTLQTGKLSVLGGASVGGVTFSSGDGGNVILNATESVELIGISSFLETPSTVGSVSFGEGNAGSIAIATKRLTLRDGAEVSVVGVAAGNAGNIALDATEFVEVRGTSARGPSQITASVMQLDSTLGFSFVPTGTSGDLIVRTERLSVAEGGQVTVRNDGVGDAGSLQVRTDALLLDREGRITATTASGEGGNIDLQIGASLQLRDRSQVSAEAGGTGSGGNIAIATNTLVLLENSTITANALAGNGGNIAIATQGLFSSPESLITASSEFGVDGIVAIAQPEIDTSTGLVELARNVPDPKDRVETGCSIDTGSAFTVTGRGGLPADPIAPIEEREIWRDLRDFSDLAEPATENIAEFKRPAVARPSRREIVPLDRQEPAIEATGWTADENGNVVLLARRSEPLPSLLSGQGCSIAR